MNSQNRMNAGAEYVLYRIWAALQEEDGIHPESLLTCVGALAGYACQHCVRQTAALPGADPAKYALRAVEGPDGATYISGDALNLPLTESPLSVWSLVSRALQLLDEPLPDLDGIQRHVAQTVGTGAFGIPRIPDDGPHPRHTALVYLRQVWPQVLPIALRFCRKPAQIPVLFGIALQRAIEQTQDTLNPTLSASIAMECAVAMSKVALPDALANPVVEQSTATTGEMKILPMPPAAPTRGKAAESKAPRRAGAKRKGARGEEVSTPGVRAMVASLPRAARIGAIVSLAIITTAGAMYKGERGTAREIERDAARVARQLVSPKFGEGAPVAEQPPPPEQPVIQEAQVSEEPPPSPEPPPIEEAFDASGAPPAEPSDDWMAADSLRQRQAQSDGNSDMLPPPEY